jgi:UDP-glucose 4-epimerase
VPILEDFPVAYTNPYGHTKLVCEQMFAALRTADPDWRFAVLRYFNPVGAHPSGRIGEDPSGPPNNLVPYVSQVAAGKRPFLNIYGKDYDTPDGTGVRDYIHVMDLAEGHVAALKSLVDVGRSFTVNLGTGSGHSVLEVVRAFEEASGQAVPYRFADRRPGDIARCYADASLAQSLLGWRASRTLPQMCADAWRWQSANPDGYATTSPRQGADRALS